MAHPQPVKLPDVVKLSSFATSTYAAARQASRVRV